MLLIMAALLGAVMAVILAGYAVVTIKCPFERVAFYLTFLASDVVIAILAYVLLSHGAFLYITTLLLAKLLCWSLMNHKNMIHYNLED